MDVLLFDRDGPVVTLTPNRPEERNPRGEAEDAEAFAAACSRINADRTVRVVILTGAGSAFSAGGHLKRMRARLQGPPETGLEIRERHRKAVYAVVRAIWGIKAPLITAINGPALGLGDDVAYVGDMRIAAEGARSGAPFLRMGLVPGDGGNMDSGTRHRHGTCGRAFFHRRDDRCKDRPRLGPRSAHRAPNRALERSQGACRTRRPAYPLTCCA